MDALASTTEETSDYLANEVIARFPSELADFMARISVFDEFDADLCTAVTGRADSPLHLEEIVRGDLFIYLLDVAGRRFGFDQVHRPIASATARPRSMPHAIDTGTSYLGLRYIVRGASSPLGNRPVAEVPV